MFDFHVIGIGSSAGGFEPLKEILPHLPADINAAIILIQHIPEGAKSSLDKLIQRFTKLKVVAVETIEYIEPGHVYLMAYGQALVVKEKFVQIAPRKQNEKINRTIDTLFQSLSTEVKEKSVGIILSGAGHDGIEGAKAIEDEGGLIIVQDPETAQFPMMPQSLIANDHPDYVLSPEQIVRKVIDHVRE